MAKLTKEQREASEFNERAVHEALQRSLYPARVMRVLSSASKEGFYLQGANAEANTFTLQDPHRDELYTFSAEYDTDRNSDYTNSLLHFENAVNHCFSY